MNKKTSQLLLALAIAALPAAAIADAGAANAAQSGSTESFIDKEWFNRINLSGFGAVGYARTSSEGADKHGSFEVQEAKLFLDADVTDDVSFFYEMDLVTEANAGTGSISSNEAYIDFANVMGADSFAIRAGRMDIPFGEEYTMEDAINNPLIDHSIGHIDGNSEGVMAYGTSSDIGWKIAVTNGFSDRGQDENSNKAVNLKANYNINDDLYVSASYEHNKTTHSATKYSGHSIEGADFVSYDGAGADVKWNFDGKSNLWASYGHYWVDDVVDYDLTYYIVQPTFYLNDDLYVVARYSAYGSFDSDRGVEIAAKNYGNGDDFGYNLESADRIQFGLGYMIRPNVIAKVEYHRDSFEEIVDSSLDDSRDFYGAQVVAKF